MEDNKNQINKITPPKPNLASGVKINTAQTKPITKFEKTSDKKNTTIVTKEKINKKTTTPKSFKFKVITSVIAIIIVLALLTSLVYFAFIKPSQPIHISINFSTEQNFIVNEQTGQANNKDVMPGDNIDLSYIIKSETVDGETSGDVYVRITSYAICENNYYGDFFKIHFNDNNWFKGNDGYYYYSGILVPDMTIDSVKYIQISETVGREFAGKTVDVCIIAEALQVGDGSIESMWPTAPEEWMDLVD